MVSKQITERQLENSMPCYEGTQLRSFVSFRLIELHRAHDSSAPFTKITRFGGDRMTFNRGFPRLSNGVGATWSTERLTETVAD